MKLYNLIKNWKMILILTKLVIFSVLFIVGTVFQVYAAGENPAKPDPDDESLV